MLRGDCAERAVVEDEDEAYALPGRRPLHEAGVRFPEEVPEVGEK